MNKIAITGNDISKWAVQFKGLGGIWVPTHNIWEVPDDKAKQALSLDPSFRIYGKTSSALPVLNIMSFKNNVLTIGVEAENDKLIELKLKLHQIGAAPRVEKVDNYQKYEIPINVASFKSKIFNVRELLSKFFKSNFSQEKWNEIVPLEPQPIEEPKKELEKEIEKEIPKEEPKEEPVKPKIKDVKLADDGRVKFVIVYESAKINDALRRILGGKSLWPMYVKAIDLSADDNDNFQYTYALFLNDNEKIKDTLDVFKSFVDTSELDQFLSQIPAKEPEPEIFKEPEKEPEPEKNPELEKALGNIIYRDEEKNEFSGIIKAWNLLNSKQQTQFHQLIFYTFPESKFAGKETKDYDQRARSNSPEAGFKATGDYDQYMQFIRMLDRYGFDSKQIKRIVNIKLARGDLKKGTHEEGELPENFKENISKKLPPLDIEMYDYQNDGIAFLYSRKMAILGDSTGAGKTIMTIGAAYLKVQEKSGDNRDNILIFTVNPQKQEEWKSEIIRFIGVKNADQISLDPRKPKKWTIARYSMFSASPTPKEGVPETEIEPKKIDIYKAFVKGGRFKIVIFDEIHKIKNEDTNRSVNIAEATKNIPYKWGATATISANRPEDAKNQLLMIGHPLGRIDSKKFKEQFGGKGQEDKSKAAENLNKWLHLTGVYIRREKEDAWKSKGMENAPNLKKEEIGSSINADEFRKNTRDRLMRYKKPDSKVSQLIAARTEMAKAKVDSTVAEVRKLVQKPCRVIVFTCFGSAPLPEEGEEKNVGGGAGSAQLLVLKIGNMLKEINPAYKVLDYIGTTPEKERKEVKKKFTDDENYKVLVMSMRMGGTGMDFPNQAGCMVINDFDWTPESMEQSEGRIFRINTKNDVFIHYMIAKGTIDEKLYELVQEKAKLAKIIQHYRQNYIDDINEEDSLANLEKYKQHYRDVDKEADKVLGNFIGSLKENYSFKDFADAYYYEDTSVFDEEEY